MKDNKQRVDLIMPKPQVQKLKKLSDKTGLTISELIRRAVDEFLKKE